MKRQLELMEITEKIINEGLRIALRERSAVRSLELFLEHLGRHSRCERIYIFEGKRGENVCNSFEWCAENVSEQKSNLQDVPFEAVRWWYDTFENKGSIVIKDVDSIKDKEPLTYEYLHPQNIHSLIASPLVIEDTIIGFYGVDNPPKEIMEHIVDVAEIIGHFIVSLLEKQKLMKQLVKLSFEDPLTEVYNRHALSDYIARHSNIKNIGVIYCDVLGLKRVNDTLGHLAGDDLIIRASECLKANFKNTEIYRIGGDEFLVVCEGMEQNIFEDKVTSLRSNMQEKNAIMSIGCIWEQETADVDALIGKADNMMYLEKRAYYDAKQ